VLAPNKGSHSKLPYCDRTPKITFANLSARWYNTPLHLGVIAGSYSMYERLSTRPLGPIKTTQTSSGMRQSSWSLSGCSAVIALIQLSQQRSWFRRYLMRLLEPRRMRCVRLTLQHFLGENHLFVVVGVAIILTSRLTWFDALK
jgi:hypothetical protein